MSPDDHGIASTWLLLPPSDVTLSVEIAPVPDIALASLRERVVAVRDLDGSLVDWALAPGEVHQHGFAVEYAAWRQTWRRSWSVGPVTNLVSLRAYAHELDDDLVTDLDDVLARTIGGHESGVEVPFDQLRAFAEDLAMVRLALSVEDRTGHGIVDDMAQAGHSAGLARAWAPPSTEVILAATPNTAVVLRPATGLTVLHSGPQFEAFEDVVSVDLRSDPVTLVDADGTSFDLLADDARPLAWLVPQSLRWHVRPIPLAAVWAPWFSAWDAAIELAESLGGVCTLSSRLTFE